MGLPLVNPALVFQTFSFQGSSPDKHPTHVCDTVQVAWLLCVGVPQQYPAVQFKPQYNTYTMYNDMDAEDGAAPSDQSGSRPNTGTENPYHKDRIDAGKF